METKKKVEICVETTDGKKVSIGDTVIFSCGGRNLVGKYDGIDNRGNWKFDGLGDFKEVYFTVAPRSIQKMYLAEVKILDGDF